MIKQFFLLTAVAVCPAALAAKDNSAAQNLLRAAAEQCALLDSSNKPFVMDVDFTVQLEALRQGHLQLRWEAKDRWWSKVTVGSFEQVKFQNGEKSYTLRNAEFTPMQVSDLMALMNVGRSLDKLVAKRDKQHIENGAAVDCIEAERPGSNGETDQICIELNAHRIVTDTRKWSTQDVQTKQFSDFVEFGGRQYPRRLQLDKKGVAIMTANVTVLKEEALNPQLLVPRQGAIERRECPDKQMPTIVRAPEPDFGDIDLPNGTSNLLEVTVLPDGKVGPVHVLESAGKRMDDDAIRSLKYARFKPAMCGNEPVVTEVTIESRVRR